MLRYNVLVEGGLVNGAMGVITQIFWPNYRRDQMYDNDIPDLQIEFDRMGIHRLTPIADHFSYQFYFTHIHCSDVDKASKQTLLHRTNMAWHSQSIEIINGAATWVWNHLQKLLIPLLQEYHLYQSAMIY
ncbi:hypothetical protein NPIL_217071 [Nephila pilipes]|uniref:Uncharacterized protein n=1 Tax=Nephila pilipes TaxID=299642 RepID=A0A8X6U8L6_NEPPI|nr:hypothetical protein NPIL_217071 [Nephila pilipes]